MDTSNKLRVVDDDVRVVKRTDSGGVQDPSDLKHYPSLGSREAAMSKDLPAQRRLSHFNSFKDSLLAEPALNKLQDKVDTAGSSTSTAGVEGQRSAKPDNASLATSSPRILAQRSGTAEPDLLAGPSQQVSWIFDATPGTVAKLLSSLYCKSFDAWIQGSLSTSQPGGIGPGS